VQNPSLALTKSALPGTYSAVGDTIGYTYLVSNNGNVTLDAPISITDDKITAPNSVTCTQPGDGQLSPLETMTCTATYTIVQGDLDAGSVTNTATATASFDGDPVDSNQDQVTVTAVSSPALTLVKTALDSSYAAPGDVLDYELVATNTAT